MEQVHINTSATQSLITLVNGLAAQIEELKDDPEALQALADEIRGTNDAIASAVTANTPSAPPPAAPDEPAEPTEPTAPV